MTTTMEPSSRNSNWQTTSSLEQRQQPVDHTDAMYRRNIPFSRSVSHAAAHSGSSLPSMATYSNKSASIPISNSIRRTSSETQLSQDEAEADYKDFLFYSRVVHGISSKQRYLQNGYLKYETQMCLNSIVNTRHADIQKQQDFDWEDQLTELGFIDGQYHQDPAAVAPAHESSDDGIFALDL
mmetsp:Transcript_130508/g.194322  ORF Transcript_130508/g.194322 Transcript_130508/m.194322 type:complete len:182 (+) Transcript_130508:138-683(+)